MSEAAAAAPAALPSVAEPTHAASLDRVLVRGIAWTGALKWGSQLVAWVCTLIVARMLAPSHYGVFAMATMFLALVALVSEFGIGVAVITLRDLADEQVAQINSLAVMFGLAAFAVSCAGAVPLGRFFATPELPSVVIALSAAFILTAVRVVPEALLKKELRFKWLAFVDGIQTLVGAVSMVLFALYGLGQWAFVLSGLLGVSVSTTLIMVSRRHRFAWPRLRSLRNAITFSRQLVASRLAYYFYSNADQLVVGKLLGNTALGVYTLALTLALMLPNKLSALMASVAPPILSTVQHQAPALRRYLLSLTEGTALIVFPATLGLAAVADEFVPIVLGEKWRGMIVPLQVLAAYVGFRSIASLPVHTLVAVGQTRFVMWSHIVTAVVLPFAFYIGSRWGLVGIATVWALVHPPLNLVICRRAFRQIGLSAQRYLAVLSPALVASLLMLIAIWLVDRTVQAAGPLRLGVEIITGVMAYVFSIVALQRHRIDTFSRAWRLLRAER
jgi:teichuronic acid exporter